MKNRKYLIFGLIIFLFFLSESQIVFAPTEISGSDLLNTTNGASNYSIINSNGAAIDYPVVLKNSSQAFVVKLDAVNSSSFYSINIFNNTIVRAQRRSVPLTSPDNFSWFLVEFDSGIRVQRGNLTIPDSTGVSSTANLSQSINLSRSFPIVYSTVNATPARVASSLLYVNFTNSTQLYFYKNSSLSSTETEWQVVEFLDNTTVQSGTFVLNRTVPNGVKDINITINDVNLSKAFVVFYYNSNGSNVAQRIYLRANLTNTTNIQFMRNNSGVDAQSALNVSWYVVNLSHENATSQQIDVNIPTNEQGIDINITSVNISRSIIIGSFTCDSSVGATGTDRCFITANFTNSTQVRFFRISDDLRTPAQGTYYIVQFPFTDNTVIPIYNQSRNCVEFNNASTIGTGLNWTTPNNASSSDNNYTTATLAVSPTNTNFLKATNCGFSLAQNATIVGIQAEAETSEGIGVTATEGRSRLVKANTTQTADVLDTSCCSTTDTYYKHGNNTALWSGTWNYSDINNKGFGYAYQLNASVLGLVRVDHIRMIVYYIENTSLPCWNIDQNLKQLFIPNNCTYFSSGKDFIGM